MEDDDPYLTLRQIADMLGLTYRTVRNYHALAVRRRRDGGTRPGDMPVPDWTVSRAPLWRESTIRDWLASRPGRTGRPPNDPEGALRPDAAW